MEVGADSYKERIYALEILVKKQALEIESLNFKNGLLPGDKNETEAQRQYATAMAVVYRRKFNKKSSSVNRRTENERNVAQGKIQEYLVKFFDTSRKLGTAEALIEELEESRTKMALGLLAEYQTFFNSLYGDERLWTSMQRRVLGILKRGIEHAGLILINPTKNTRFNHERHSVKPVSVGDWRGDTDESEQEFDGMEILECIKFGIKDQDDFYKDENGIGKEPIFFQKAQVTLKPKT